MLVSVWNQTRKKELARQARVALSLRERGVGLLATARLAPGEGLWIKPCRSIHTLFMRYAIDAAFLDAEGAVLHQGTYAPWRVSRWVARAQGVLELPAGTLGSTGTQVGDRLEMKEKS